MRHEITPKLGLLVLVLSCWTFSLNAQTSGGDGTAGDLVSALKQAEVERNVAAVQVKKVLHDKPELGNGRRIYIEDDESSKTSAAPKPAPDDGENR